MAWTVVSSQKGKGKGAIRDDRSFKEVAKGIRIADENSVPFPEVHFKGEGPSGVDKGNLVISELSLSLEEHSSSNCKAFKSPKKRARELFEEVSEESEPSVEILRVFRPVDLEDYTSNP